MALSDADAAALFSRLDDIEDRRARRGRCHQQRSLLATIPCAVVSGAQGSSAISESVERVYLIGSQGRAQASPEQLPALNRGHWGLENRLHHVRDMADDAERCHARKGNSPRALACRRSSAISLLRLHHVPGIKAALRDLAAQASKVLTSCTCRSLRAVRKSRLPSHLAVGVRRHRPLGAWNPEQ